MSDSSAGTVVLVHGGFADGSGSQGVYHELTNDQVPWGLDAATGTIDEPAWRSKTSWYLATTDDRMIPPALEREMSERAGATVAETPAAIRSTSRSRALWPTSSSGLLPAWAD
jgi:hypothetical protein